MTHTINFSAKRRKDYMEKVWINRKWFCMRKITITRVHILFQSFSFCVLQILHSWSFKGSWVLIAYIAWALINDHECSPHHCMLFMHDRDCTWVFKNTHEHIRTVLITHEHGTMVPRKLMSTQEYSWAFCHGTMRTHEHLYHQGTMPTSAS